MGEFVIGAGEADLESFNLAEPSIADGFGDAGLQVVADLLQPRPLRRAWLRFYSPRSDSLSTARRGLATLLSVASLRVRFCQSTYSIGTLVYPGTVVGMRSSCALADWTRVCRRVVSIEVIASFSLPSAR